MSFLLSWLHDNVFHEKFAEDARQPWIVWKVPALEQKIGVVGVDPRLGPTALVVLGMATMVDVLVCFMLFQTVVKPAKSANKLLLGYGLVCPITVMVYLQLILFFDLRNQVFLLMVSIKAGLAFFRCIEAIHGNTPTFATHNVKSYYIYYASNVQFVIDPDTQRTQPTSRAKVRQLAGQYATICLQAVLLFSVLTHYDYFPFARYDPTKFSPWRLFHYGHLLNNFLLALLTSCCLEGGACFSALITSALTGLECQSLNDHPLWCSTSVSDFWGRRWNKLVSDTLKRALYKPMRAAGSSQAAALLAVFVASGLFHEFILTILRMQVAPPQSSWWSGRHLAFFSWNAIVMVVERALHLPERMQRYLPRPVQTVCVLMMVLPMAHWFVYEYVDLGVYTSLGLGFPRIVLLSP